MAEYGKNFSDITIQLLRFTSSDLSKKTTLFVLEGGGGPKDGISKLTILAFPPPENSNSLRTVMLTDNENLPLYASVINKLANPLCLRNLKPKATLETFAKEISFARRENLPLAALLVGPEHASGDLVVFFTVLNGVNPKDMYSILRMKCREQLARLN